MEGASSLLWLNCDPGAGIASASAGDDGNASTPLRDRAGRIYPASPTATVPSLHLRRPFGAHATMCDVYLSGVLREVSDGAATACVGDRVAHVQRGNGTVVVVEETAASANPRVHVKFDASGDTHRYDAVSLSSGKITRLSNERDGSIN